MEGERFNPTPAMDEDGKEAEDGMYEMARNEELQMGEQEIYRDFASTSGSGLSSPQESTSRKLSMETGSKVLPYMSHSGVNQGSNTSKTAHNREDGYEPAQVVPYFAGSVGIVFFCLLLAGWTSGDGRSIYNVDISGIVANKVKLPDGRHIAYEEKGVSRDVAKINILVAHGFLSCRLAGVVMFGPMGNPYATNMTKEETKTIWKRTDRNRRWLYRLARHFPSLLPGFLKKGIVGKPVKLMRQVKKSVNPKDLALLETDKFGENWERSIREAMRSGDTKAWAEDVILHCNDWGYKLTDLNPKPAKKSLFNRIFSLFGGAELPPFTGPIHIYHGAEDALVPLTMSQHAKRMLPQVHLHVLEGHGHFSWFCYCDSCHRELFKALFGEVEGLHELEKSPEPQILAPEVPEAPAYEERTISSEAAPHEDPHVAETIDTATLETTTETEPEGVDHVEVEIEQDSFSSKVETTPQEAEVGISGIGERIPKEE
uniref:AB hydrolase-1 domain-containing protein n=1 Tax=Physcomitrium patens TaxID=3218 RepID=A0A7I4BLY5_PHYPA